MLLEVSVAQTGDRSSMKPLQGNPQGAVKTVPAGDTGTVTAPVPNNLTNTVLVAANLSRVGLMIFNNSTQALHLKLSSVAMAAATDLSVKVASQAAWTMPVGYTGAVNGMLAGADGAAVANVTQITTA